METIRTRTHVENGHITVDVPAHWNNKDVEVVLVAHDLPVVPVSDDSSAVSLTRDLSVVSTSADCEDAKIGNGAHIMAIAQSIIAAGGVTWPMDVMEWQRAERQDRPLPGCE